MNTTRADAEAVVIAAYGLLARDQIPQALASDDDDSGDSVLTLIMDGIDRGAAEAYAFGYVWLRERSADLADAYAAELEASVEPELYELVQKYVEANS